MQVQATKKRSDEDMWNAIKGLNLDPIKIKLMDSEEGEGWDRATADRLEIEYKRFLFLTVTNTVPIVPNKQVDAFWHQHILDTRKYADDCENTFGYFLHHFPYFGMRGSKDAENLASAFAETKRIYEQAFGPTVQAEAQKHCSGCSDCSAGSDCAASVKLDAMNCSSCGAGSCGGSGCVNSSCSGDARSDILAVEVRPTFAEMQ